jgi:hypothetical protein
MNQLSTDQPKSKSRPNTKSSEVVGPVVSETPGNLVVSVRAEQPALLIRPVFQDGHWSATRRRLPLENSPESNLRSEWTSCEVGEVDFLKQGIVVPPGTWQIQFRYQPWWWIPSTMAATAGWMILIGSWIAGWIVIGLRQRPKSPNSGVLR